MKNVFAAILSIFLVLILILMPLCTSVVSLLSTDTISDLLDEIDIKEIVSDSISIDGEENKVFSKALDKSDYLEELISECTEYMTAPLFGETKRFTKKDFIEITEAHIDELVQVAKETIPEYNNFTDAQIEEKILASINEMAPEFIDELKMLRENTGIDTMAQGIKAIRIITYIIVAVAIILTVSVFLLTYKKFNGFFWMLADYGIAALLGFILCAALNNIIKILIPKDLSDDILENIIDFLSERLFDGYNEKIIIYIIIAAVCLCAGIAGKVFLTNKNKLKEQGE